ncbi:MAG TPA: ATP-binding protein [Bacteroidales bacterium]|nr:ATP-binding protein [Bacteroidales bacterium]
MITRILEDVISDRLFTGKTILLLGPRQVGKTTLIKGIFQKHAGRSFWMNADNPEDRALLNGINSLRARELFLPGTLVVVDEAQRLENSGLTLKIIHDACPDIQLVATGSSSFELTDKIKESLTGRKWSFRLFPISFKEIELHTNFLDLIRSLEVRMIFGSYPEVINQAGREKEVLHELISDYLYKDVFTLKGIRKPEILEKLVKALAFQIGSQVSYRELSNLVQADKETVERYIYLLEEAFIIFRLTSFSRNLRSELKRSHKFYFYDNGIRNAVISQFNPLSLRNDTGALWENLLISERKKVNEYHRRYRNVYFWRTDRQQELDYLEEYDGRLHAYEFKWQDSAPIRAAKAFQAVYPDSDVKLIHRDNFMEFIKS